MKPSDLKELLDAATPAPWRRIVWALGEDGEDGFVAEAPRQAYTDEGEIQAHSDADFISIARGLLPLLLQLWETAKHYQWAIKGGSDDDFFTADELLSAAFKALDQYGEGEK